MPILRLGSSTERSQSPREIFCAASHASFWIGSSGPEEPIQKLAWDAAQKISRGLCDLSVLDPSLRIGMISAGTDVPEKAISYLKGSLENHLQNAGVNVSEAAGFHLTGYVFRRNGELVFALTIYKEQAAFLSDSVSVPWDNRVENTLAQFEPEHRVEQHHLMHKEMPVPSPLVEPKEAPLDVSQLCGESSCSLLLLYPDRL